MIKKLEQTKPDISQKIAALRKATGRPERFILNCACAVKDKGFSVIMERFDDKVPFTIASTVTEAGDSSGASPAPRTLKASDVDFTGWKCPFCGDTGGTVSCQGCNTVICSGRVRREDGSRMFHCRDSCGLSSALSPVQEIRGGDGRERAGTSTALPRLANAARSALGASSPSLPLLPSKKS